MKTKIVITLMSVFFFIGLNQNVFSQQNKKKGKETVTFYVENMNCKNCQAKIEKNIAFEKGVSDLSCDLETKTVKVTYKSDKTNPEALKDGFAKIGMNATVSDDSNKEDKK
jgi:copper chaperone CopZ